MISNAEKDAAFAAYDAARAEASKDDTNRLLQNQGRWNGIFLMTLALHGHRVARRPQREQFSAGLPNVKLWINAHTSVVYTVVPTHLHFADELDLWSGQPLPVP